jgi:hypothetical protein
MCEPDWRRLLCDGDRGLARGVASLRAILLEGTPCYHGISIDYIDEGSTIVVHGLHVSLWLRRSGPGSGRQALKPDAWPDTSLRSRARFRDLSLFYR